MHINVLKEKRQRDGERVKRFLNKTLQRPPSYIDIHIKSPKLRFHHTLTLKGIAERKKKIHNQSLKLSLYLKSQRYATTGQKVPDGESGRMH